MTQEQKPTPVRMKLTVISVETGTFKAKDGKELPKATFKAKDGDKEFTFVCFSKTLMELIKVSAVLDADVVTSTREHQGNIYTDRKVVQIYVDGKGVSVSGSGRPWRDDSPETRAAILEQCQAKIIANLWIAGKCQDNDPMVVRLKGWLSGFVHPIPGQQASGSSVGPTPKSEAKNSGGPSPEKSQSDKDIKDLFEDKPHLIHGLDVDWLKGQLEKNNKPQSAFIAHYAEKFSLKALNTLDAFMESLTPEQVQTIRADFVPKKK